MTDIRERVRERYAAAARAAGSGSGCCSSGLIAAGEEAKWGASLYGDRAGEVAVEASLGCGVPTAVADLTALLAVMESSRPAPIPVRDAATKAAGSLASLRVELSGLPDNVAAAVLK